MNVSFTRELQRLDPAQLCAVETVEGPVMCIAGPGTGKTQVLAMRVANILQKTHARPGNILCLTFSVSGATAMRERLRMLIGPDAYNVAVSTIHGFCNDLILAHPTIFEQWSALEHISDVERYRELNTIIDQLMPNCALVSKKNPYTRTRDILGRISLLKREGVIDHEHLQTVADAYEERLLSKSKEETKAHEKDALQARKFREFLDVFRRYQEMLEKTGRYDYEDMVLAVMRAFQTEDWLLASQQERFQYILVDEFQDTNGAQCKVIDLLTQPRTPEDHPNLFIVGDDDQAIYRFQGANLSNILWFVQRFPAAPIIPLTVSYRCTQEVLDAASSLIVQNTERLVGRVKGIDKTLTAASKKSGAQPMLVYSPSDMTEPFLIADIIEERLKQGTAPQEIAILTQTNAELRTYYDVLSARGIPVEMTGKVDLLMHPLVQQVIAILLAIHRPHESGKLAAALGCACFDCHPADIGRIFTLRRERESQLLELLLKFDVPGAQDPVALHRPEKLLHARDCILDLHHKLRSRTLVETLEHVLKDSGLLALPRSQGTKSKKNDAAVDPIDYAALQEFFDRVKYRCYESPSYGFEAFLSDLEFYADPYYGDLRMSYDLPHLTDDGVQLMTAHQSKGLEFHTVILTNFRDGHWNKRRNPPSLSLPEDLLFGWQKDQKEFEQNQDERRVAYVAMTRAKEELLFTCPRQLTTGERSKMVSPSAFFAEAGTLPEAERLLKHPEEASTLLFQTVRNLDDEFKSFLKNRIENFALSVTALNHFLEDPNLFLLSDLLQVPQSKKPELVYGNAVHDALRTWALRSKEGKTISQKQFLEQFDAYLREREVLTVDERLRLGQLGKESLPRYYEQRLAASKPIIGFVEHAINARLGDIPIKGKLDRIDLDHPTSSHITVIDFKTGKPKTEKEIKEGDYFRQLVFYSLLLEQGMSAYEPTAFVLDFVGEGTDHPTARTFTIAEQDKKELRAIIDAVWNKVLALDFSKV